MGLYTWLVDRASFVYAWFGHRFWSFYNYLANAYWWLQTYAQRAYAWARNWAWPKILYYYYLAIATAQAIGNGFRYWVEGRINWVYNQIQYWVSVLRLNLWSLEIRFTNWVNSKIAYWKTELVLAVGMVELKIWAVKNELLNKITNFVNDHPVLKDIINFLSPENRTKLLDLIKSGYQTLSSFYQNPIGSVIAILKPIFMEFLGYSLAYGLGTVDAELPDFPDFSVNPQNPEIPGSGGSGNPPPTNSGDGGDTRYGRAPLWLTELVQANFPAEQVRNALEISKIESGWNAHAVNNTLHLGGGQCNVPYRHAVGIMARTEHSVGLFQINICAHGGSQSFWFNPENNVAKAAALWRSGGWRPWSYSAGQLGIL